MGILLAQLLIKNLSTIRKLTRVRLIDYLNLISIKQAIVKIINKIQLQLKVNK